MTSSTYNIIVPVDFSVQSIHSIRYAGVLAKCFATRISLLYIIEDFAAMGRVYNEPQEKSLKKNIQLKLEKVIEDLNDIEVADIKIIIETGKVYEKVAEAVKTVGADLIIMGCNGSADEKNRFLGSNALRIMRSSSIPVITANPKSEFSALKHIVLPIDLTKESKEKLERALLFARLNKEIIIHILSVTFDADEYMVNRLSQQLLKVKSIIEKSKTKYTAEIVKAASGYESLGEIITDYSRKVEGDLIILMTQQEVNYTPYFVSSLAQEIINISEVPVMTVAPGHIGN